MRIATIVGTAAATAVLLGATACGTGTAAKSAAITSATPSAAATDGGSGSSGGGSALDSDVCALVRQGIDAFNQGDFDATVDHFTQAVPLAHARVVADDTRANEQLLEAVVYYAELAPDDYLDAAQSSSEFQQYKAVTLGQCEGGEPAPTSPSSPGLDT